MKADIDFLTFSTGKRMYAHNGIVGISLADEGSGQKPVFHGYDGQICLPGDNDVEPEEKLSPEECVELADQMLERWAAFRASYSKA